MGANWHAWSDRYAPSDEGTQIAIGLVQREDAVRRFEAGSRWEAFDAKVADTNARILDLISGATGL